MRVFMFFLTALIRAFICFKNNLVIVVVYDIILIP